MISVIHIRFDCLVLDFTTALNKCPSPCPSPQRGEGTLITSLVHLRNRVTIHTILSPRGERMIALLCAFRFQLCVFQNDARLTENLPFQ